jgi:hypothetical protein
LIHLLKFVLAGRATSTGKSAGQVASGSQTSRGRQNCAHSTRADAGLSPKVGAQSFCQFGGRQSGDSVRRKVPSSESAGRCSDFVLACVAFIALYFFWFEFIWEATAK